MARVRKTILEVGTWQSPEGEVRVTPERIRHWADQHTAMTAAGIKVPVPYGHQRKARPYHADDADGQAYLASKFNAGYLPEMKASKDGKRLEAIFDVPGAEEKGGNLITWTKRDEHSPLLACAIGEVSAAIAKKFTDGTGKVWDDVIAHAALVPLPVYSGQDGFTKLATDGCEDVTTLAVSAAGWTTLASKEPAVSNKFPPEAPVEHDDLEAEPTPEVETEPPPPAPAPDDPMMNLGRLMPLLAEHGITLPEGTTPENLVERMITAITALKGRLTNKDEPEPPGEPIVENTDNQMLMSLIRDKPGLGRIVDRQRESVKQANLNKIATLKRRGLSAHQIEELTARVNDGVQNLSLTADGDLVEHKRYTFGNVLDTLLLALPKLAGRQLTKTLSAADEQRGPSKIESAAEQAKITKEMAAMALGRPVDVKTSFGE